MPSRPPLLEGACAAGPTAADRGGWGGLDASRGAKQCSRLSISQGASRACSLRRHGLGTATPVPCPHSLRSCSVLCIAISSSPYLQRGRRAGAASRGSGRTNDYWQSLCCLPDAAVQDATHAAAPNPYVSLVPRRSIAWMKQKVAAPVEALPAAAGQGRARGLQGQQHVDWAKHLCAAACHNLLGDARAQPAACLLTPAYLLPSASPWTRQTARQNRRRCPAEGQGSRRQVASDIRLQGEQGYGQPRGRLCAAWSAVNVGAL